MYSFRFHIKEGITQLGTIRYSTKPIRLNEDLPVIIDGVRTPFIKSFGSYKNISPLGLFSRVVDALIRKVEVDDCNISSVVCGTVISHLENHNLARDVILELGLDRNIHGMTLNRACTSSLQSVISSVDSILAGNDELSICGGVENLTDCPISYSKEARQFLINFSRAKSSSDRMAAIKSFSAKSFLPSQPDVTEAYTGLSMGEHAEIMAKRNEITRKDQDEFAVASHQKASIAREQGFFNKEIVPVWVPSSYKECVLEDNIIREDTTIEGISGLKPSFDKRFGSLTAANSSALTDGASACLITSDKKAKSLNLNIKAYIKDYCTVGVEPTKQLLIGPALAIPLLLKRNELTVEDIDYFEIHEAFAAQVLSCLKCMKDPSFLKEHLSEDFSPIDIPFEKINPNGGALAIGHPFGATGTRLLLTLANQLEAKKKRYGVVAICAAGGLAQALLLERREG